MVCRAWQLRATDRKPRHSAPCRRRFDVAQPGDTILVRTGTYKESIRTARSGTAGAPITVRGDDESGPVVMTIRGTVLQIDHSFVVVEKLTLTRHMRPKRRQSQRRHPVHRAARRARATIGPRLRRYRRRRQRAHRGLADPSLSEPGWRTHRCAWSRGGRGAWPHGSRHGNPFFFRRCDPVESDGHEIRGWLG